MVQTKIYKTQQIKKHKKINSSKSFNDRKSKLKNRKYNKTKKHVGGWNLFGIGNKDILQCSKCSLSELISKIIKFISSFNKHPGISNNNTNKNTYYREYYDKSDLTKYKSYRLFDITSDFFSIEGTKSDINQENYPELLFIKETYKGRTSTTVKIGYFLHLTEIPEIPEIPEISQNNSNQKIIIRRFFKPFKEYNFKVLRKYYKDKDSKKPYYIIENFDYERNLELVAEFNQKSNEDNLNEKELKTFSQTLTKNYLLFPNFISLFNYLQIFEKLESSNNLIRNSYTKMIDLKDYYLFIYQKYDNKLSVRSDFFKYFLVGIIEKFDFYYDTDDNKKYMKIKTKLNPIQTQPYAKIDINKNKNKKTPYDIFIYNFTINNNKPETEPETEPEFILDHYNKCMIIVHSESSKCKDVNFTSTTDTCYLFNKLIKEPIYSQQQLLISNNLHNPPTTQRKPGHMYIEKSSNLPRITPYLTSYENPTVYTSPKGDELEYNVQTMLSQTMLSQSSPPYSLAAQSSPPYSLAVGSKPDYAEPQNSETLLSIHQNDSLYGRY